VPTANLRRHTEPEMRKLEIDPTLQDDTKVYRYISLETFLALVETERTHLTKVTTWDDPWEAILSRIPVVDDDGKTLKTRYSFHEGVFGQCWSLLRESDAMWRIYSTSATGLVIATTVKKLELLRGAERLYVGRVVYFDGPRDLLAKARSDRTMFDAFCFKRSAYDHEQEVSVLTHAQAVAGSDYKARYITLTVDPPSFVNEIIIDPRASPWLVDAVKQYC
jgi:hypothetical protein